jgi:hypothetical protein
VYERDFNEIDCFGRGNFGKFIILNYIGAAYRVKERSSGEIFIAKKIVLGNLNDK